MPKSLEMERFLDGLSQSLFGRSRTDGVCVACGSQKVGREDFRNKKSAEEYEISRLCQVCQDKVFGKDRR